ncbi:MAG: hypothetical protein O7G84_00915 [Gammaproteobacteria bacterium]|nr:hypothetical protein [Gammaproteobacteria bacterium]
MSEPTKPGLFQGTGWAMNAKAGKLDRLNAALTAAAEGLYALNLGAAAEIPMGGDTYLMWAKHDGKWGLYVYSYNESLRKGKAPMKLVPILQAEADHRILAAGHLNALLEAVRVASGEALRGIEDAISAAQSFAEGMAKDG